MLNGDYKKGFELYEYRFLKNKSKLTNRVNSIPELKNKKILVVSEQGFGDTIQFARYLPLLKPHVKNLDFHPPSELHDVFKNTNINLVKKFKIENYDEVIPLMSLPFIFKTTLNTIPTCDYLNLFKTKNKFSSGKIKIGLAWSGRNTYPYDFLRSIPLSKLKNIYDLDNDKFDFYCLQKNIRTSDTKCFEQSKIIYVGDKNFFDITKVILEMDLVVSSDTSILHLASSLQIKTFGLIPFCPDWRWLLDKNDLPWYSSLKLYRCNHDNDWNNLSCKVANDINLLFN